MCIADDSDLGTGLHFTRAEINNRPATKTRLASLIQALGGNPEDPSKPLSLLDPINPEHALSLLFDMDYIEPSSLSMDVHNASYSLIHWKPGAEKASTASTLANGNHRMKLIQSRYAKELDTLRSFTRILDLADGPAFVARRLELEASLRHKASWLVAVYDLGKALTCLCCLPTHL